MKDLTSLSLYGTKVTGAGLGELAPLEKLTTLNLAFSEFDDAGLKRLGRLKRLTSLDLGVTRVTDAGLKELAPLTRLTSLDLSVTKVTDAGLKGLRKTCLDARSLTDRALDYCLTKCDWNGFRSALETAAEKEKDLLRSRVPTKWRGPMTEEGAGLRSQLTREQARHDGQVRLAVASGSRPVLVLGGSHDLSASVRKLGCKVEYVRVAAKRYREFAGR